MASSDALEQIRLRDCCNTVTNTDFYVGNKFEVWGFGLGLGTEILVTNPFLTNQALPPPKFDTRLPRHGPPAAKQKMTKSV